MSRSFLRKLKIFFRMGSVSFHLPKQALLCYHKTNQGPKGELSVIEIVFSESAYGSLLVGQSYGRGEYPGGATAVFLTDENGSQPAAEVLWEAQEKARARMRRAWEDAIPLGGAPGYVYCFDLALSIGEISEAGIGGQRRAALEMILSIDPARAEACPAAKTLEKARKSLAAVLERAAAGEDLRIWYSHNPDEMCGMHWLLAQLRPLKQRGTVHLVRLPEWECREDGIVCIHNGWGEIGPGGWGRFQRFGQEAQPAFIAMCAQKWSRLQEENAPLRIFLNGNLQSAPSDLYDSFILRELAAQPEEFREAIVIGNVLGKYQLGIGDGWLALRIGKLIEEGKLEVVESAPEDGCCYRRTLRKCISPATE